jgi:hypothetical protein
VRRSRTVTFPVAVLLMGAAAGMPSVLAGRQSSAGLARICTASKKAFAALPAPTTIAAAEAGLTQWRKGRYSDKVDPNSFERIGLDLNFYEMDLDTLVGTMMNGDGPAATDGAQRSVKDLDVIEKDAKKIRVVACRSASFGRAYVTALGPLVRSALALTGNFSTDATAACARFEHQSGQLNPLDLLDPTAQAGFLANFGQDLKGLSRDFAAITPPAGHEQQFASFRAVIDQLVATLNQASTATSSQLPQIQTQLSSLSDQLGTVGTSLGITC